MELLEILIAGGLISGICCIANILGKCYIAKISKNLSNDKVKYLSKMMSKDININLHQ